MAADQQPEFDESTPAAAKKGAAVKKSNPDALSGKKVKLTIHKDPSKHAVKDVFVGLNGVGYQIQRGVSVVVPEEVANVLRDAVEMKVEQEEDGTIVHREVPSYPFSIEPA